MAAETPGPQNENCTTEAGASSSLEQPPQSKAKKFGKKKSTTASSETPRQTSATAESQAGENTGRSTEEEFKRQLDWCIEQLELGMKSHKATPRQREDASHGLKTLCSSKAPLVKKRQVMRAMTGDYRKKMEEEKHKQFKLIKSEVALAQVKVKSGSPRKSVFHRRAEGKQEENRHQSEAQESNPKAPQEGFVFTASKGEFRFNFL
uniref:UPF0488 protein C8orf33 homolog n=1 Tax=Doryrhamphus excisus TaxID=161450 RepID=UPI0025ADBF68|nr:UPF0488 protein C8orf33 homolog [Doryrhamphus excisus]XP_057917186.1 UPF0488 protein C8orf33 homolog [Doryrhamphus excisus]XP_057917187.1 UPF0488 protein C8orf33 homolog [Doryrhamphus excisus]